MAGDGGLHGDARSLGVAYFAHQNHIRILPQYASQQLRETFVLIVTDGNLGDAIELDFDGVFDRDDVSPANFDAADK